MKRRAPKQVKTQDLAADSTPEVKLDTPQQDSNWSDLKKIEWIKDTSKTLLKVFNTQE